MRAVGELIQNQFRVGLLRMERVVKERMSIQEPDTATPTALINIRPVVAAMKEFFGGSQLQPVHGPDQPAGRADPQAPPVGPGPGRPVSRERAGFDVRDVHHSHYGRICPIETPEGPNIGLIGSLATYGRINEYGFIETPYRRVKRTSTNSHDAAGRPGSCASVTSTTKAARSCSRRATRHRRRSSPTLEKLKPTRGRRPPARDRRDRLPDAPTRKTSYIIAQANVHARRRRHTSSTSASRRATATQFPTCAPSRSTTWTSRPKQIVVRRDRADPVPGARRRQPRADGLEHAAPGRAAARAGGADGRHRHGGPRGARLRPGRRRRASTAWSSASPATQVDGRRSDDGELHTYRARASSCARTRAPASTSARSSSAASGSRRGQPLADSSSTERGELALGQNVLVAFMSLGRRQLRGRDPAHQRTLVRDDKFTSIHIEKHEVEAATPSSAPRRSRATSRTWARRRCKDLDEHGIIRVGAEVGPGDILVGKITPKGETELTAEERLLRAIFGEKAREVKDTSPARAARRARQGRRRAGLRRATTDDELPAGVNELVRVSVAQKRKISVGDKMAGRHGNKGVISASCRRRTCRSCPTARRSTSS